MTHVHFVHGFLGQLTDWHPIAEALAAVSPRPLVFHFADLWDFLRKEKQASFEKWGAQFAETLTGDDHHVVGYSLGGRLALHLPESAWPRISSMTLISSHPGLEDEAEKADRRKDDAAWAHRFLEEPWETVTADWEEQEVFRHDTSRPIRQEKDFSRKLLASAMVSWSLGEQKNLWNFCGRLPFPLHFIHGDLDARFSAVADELARVCPKARIHRVSGGHSPLFSDPKRMAGLLSRILNESMLT